MRSQYFPDAASVVRSPGAPAPTVIIVGAKPNSNIRLASIKRASRASPGLPFNCAVPRTTMTSAWRTTGLLAARQTCETAYPGAISAMMIMKVSVRRIQRNRNIYPPENASSNST
ncbi:unannotated protein [freshwater metagenome]|uniref:Unannotated protein n=1 Tax=freshwater metagenome TaxID=449393 RepID=A0A6J6U3U6_9ZZZZ